jgi:hypothetical protein
LFFALAQTANPAKGRHTEVLAYTATVSTVPLKTVDYQGPASLQKKKEIYYLM